MRTTRRLTALALVVLAGVGSVAGAAETPRRGGVLLAIIGADPPSLDAHQESTFANLQLVAPLYSTLLQIDPYEYPKIVGDVASEWKVSPDGLTYTFKIRPGIRFHDGSPLPAPDVKATSGTNSFHTAPESAAGRAPSLPGPPYTDLRSPPSPGADPIRKRPGDRAASQTRPMGGRSGITITNAVTPSPDSPGPKPLSSG